MHSSTCLTCSTCLRGTQIKEYLWPPWKHPSLKKLLSNTTLNICDSPWGVKASWGGVNWPLTHRCILYILEHACWTLCWWTWQLSLIDLLYVALQFLANLVISLNWSVNSTFFSVIFCSPRLRPIVGGTSNETICQQNIVFSCCQFNTLF